MDIYEYLKMDHKKVDKLFEMFTTATSGKNQLEIAAMLDKELTVHAESEEKTFYKALETFSTTKKEIQHAEHEHDQIKNKLAEIKKIHHANQTLHKKVMELKELVEHHVSEEENKIFDDAKEILSEELAKTLKEQMHDYKEKMLNGIKVKHKSTAD